MNGHGFIIREYFKDYTKLRESKRDSYVHCYGSPSKANMNSDSYNPHKIHSLIPYESLSPGP